MKTILLLPLVVFTTFCSPKISETPDSQKPPPEINETFNKQKQAWACQCVLEALTDIEKIKVGMKRKDLDQIFSPDGGISSISRETFIYKPCNFIKVGIRFAVTDKNQRVPKFDPEDEIVEISKPYLDYPVWN